MGNPKRLTHQQRNLDADPEVEGAPLDQPALQLSTFLFFKVSDPAPSNVCLYAVVETALHIQPPSLGSRVVEKREERHPLTTK